MISEYTIMNGNFKTISALKPVSGFAEYRADIRRAVNALRFEQKRPAEVK